MDHVTRNDLAAMKNEACGLGKKLPMVGSLGKQRSARYRSSPLRGLMVSTVAMETLFRKDSRWSLSVQELVLLALQLF